MDFFNALLVDLQDGSTDMNMLITIDLVEYKRSAAREDASK